MLKEKMDKVLTEIRPRLQADGGDIELVSIEGGVVKIKLSTKYSLGLFGKAVSFLGAECSGCSGCPFAAMPLEMEIGQYLKERLPEVKQVVFA